MITTTTTTTNEKSFVWARQYPVSQYPKFAQIGDEQIQGTNECQSVFTSRIQASCLLAISNQFLQKMKSLVD